MKEINEISEIKEEKEDKNEIIIDIKDKNEIKENKEQKEILSSENSDSLPLMPEETTMKIKLLKSYGKHDNYNKATLDDSFKKMKNFEENYLKGPDYAEIKDTPIYKLCEIMKKINSIEKKRLNRSYDYFQNKSPIINEVNIFLNRFDVLEDTYKTMSNDLYSLYEKIECKIVDKYFKEHYQEKSKLINRKEPFKIKNLIPKVELLYKSLTPKTQEEDFEKKYSKQFFENAIKNLKYLSDNKNIYISEDLKKRITNFKVKLDEGEIDEIWNFEFNLYDLDYKFRLIENPVFYLDDTKEPDPEDKSNIFSPDEQQIDEILAKLIERLIKGGKNIAIYGMAQEILETRKLTEKLFDIHYDKKDISKITGKEVARLDELLLKFSNIRAFCKLFKKYCLEEKNPKLCLETNSFFLNLFHKFFVRLNSPKNDKKWIYMWESLKKHDVFKNETFLENLLVYRFEEDLYNYVIGYEGNPIAEAEKDDEKLKSLAESFSDYFSLKIVTKTGLIKFPDSVIERAIKKVISKYSVKIQDEILKSVKSNPLIPEFLNI